MGCFSFDLVKFFGDHSIAYSSLIFYHGEKERKYVDCVERLVSIFYVFITKSFFSSFWSGFWTNLYCTNNLFVRLHYVIRSHQNWSLFNVNYIVIDCDREICTDSSVCVRANELAFLFKIQISPNWLPSLIYNKSNQIEFNSWEKKNH